MVVSHHSDLPRAPRAVAVGRVPDTHKVEQTTHDTAFHCDNDIIGVNGNVA